MGPDVAALRPALLDAAKRLALSIDDDQAGKLLHFIDLLKHWNATYNLTAIRDIGQMLTQHVVDCLAVVNPLWAHFGGVRRPLRLLDVGSGGGLPGVVISVMAPEVDVVCIDAVAKKTAFVRQVAAELPLSRLHAVHARVESLDVQPFDVIACRAFGSLPDLLSSTRKLLEPEGCWMAMKGKVPTAELQALPADGTTFHVEQLDVPGLDADRCIVWLRSAPPHRD